MTFTKGREHYAPIKFHSFEVGPYSVTLTPREDETWGELSARAHELLEELFAQEFKRQLDKYLDRVIEVSDRVSERKKG